MLGAGLLVATAGATAGVAAASTSAAEPPSITRLALGRPVLGSSGGAATIRLDARNAETCWFGAPAGVELERAPRGCAGGRDYRIVRLGPTYAARASSFEITGWVLGTDGTTIHQTVALRQDGRPPLGVAVSSTLALGQPYAEQVGVIGGHGPYSLQVTSGSLPPGISLSPDGDLSGTPTSLGTFTATVSVRDSSAPQPLQADVSLVLRVTGQPVSITTGTLATAVQGQYYRVALAASGGIAPYGFSIVSGYLPSGLTLGSAGILSGVPAGSGTYTVTVRATDSSSPTQAATRQLTLVVVRSPLQVTSRTSVTATVGVAYASYLAASGGTTPYSWSIASGSLPPGLTLSTNGLLQGTSWAVGTYAATVVVQDASEPQLSATVYLVVTVSTSTVSITTPSTLSSAAVGEAYSYTFTATGGTTPYLWLVVGGTVPPGLSLSSGGVLSGTPTSAGSYSFTVEVWDSASPIHTTTRTVSLTVSS